MSENRSVTGSADAQRAAVRRGFTMAEILVVVLIILIVATLALPAFNVMTGTKSVESATNVLSAVLARARTEAMARQQPIGVAVYFDQAQQKTALALVGYAQPWTSGTNYQRGDYVYYSSGGARAYWLCNAANLANGSELTNNVMTAIDSPPNAASPSWTPFPTTSPLPNYLASQYVSILPETEVTYLPPGISAQVMNNGPRSQNVNNPSVDEYLHDGVVFFDANGQLSPQQQWGTLFNPADLSTSQVTGPSTSPKFSSTRLGLAIRFNYSSATGTYAVTGYPSYNLDPSVAPKSGGSNLNVSTLMGGLGVILYDRQQYESQGFPAWDCQTTNVVYSGSAKQAADAWLDQNGTLVLVNRYTGTILKTE